MSQRIKSGIAGLLLGTTLLAGGVCGKVVDAIEENNKESAITSVEPMPSLEVDEANQREYLESVVNNTFSGYTAISSKRVSGSTSSDEIRCITAPNGDNVAWFGGEYYSLYSDGKEFTKDGDYSEEAEVYAGFKDFFLEEVVNDDAHEITKVQDGVYKIDDRDCNVYEIVIKDGKICKIIDVYTDYKTGESQTRELVLSATTQETFEQNMKNAIAEIASANEYFGGLTK